MVDIAFTSSIPVEHRDEVERMLFFNGNQAKVVDSVELVTERYGMPRLRVVADRLRITMESHEPQTLFAVARNGERTTPIGGAVYLREGDTLQVLFVALHEDYCTDGEHGDVGLLRRMVAELTGIARRVRGVAALSIYFGRATPTRIVIRRPARP
jgi:hypothetical protein